MSHIISVSIDPRDGFSYAVADVLAAVCEEFGFPSDDNHVSEAIADCVDRMGKVS